jgi:hypothetical protein
MVKLFSLFLGLFFATSTPSNVLPNLEQNPALIIPCYTCAIQKAEETADWRDLITEPVLIMLGKCEAPDGKGGIDLNAYNPKDTDGKEKFGPFQFDCDTFYGAAERFGLEDANIASTTHQVILTKKLISVHEWWRWPTCWMKRMFPR